MPRFFPARRSGFTVLETVVVLVCLATFLTIAAIAYQRHTDTVYRRICWQQQRTLQGQLESLPAPDLDVSIDEIFAQLIQAGQISGQMTGPTQVDSVQISDPGFGPGSFRNYVIMSGSKMVGCKNHGSVFDDNSGLP